ncbi:MAG: N-acetylglucosamine-6-phosphate deacetylase [Planctomycetota bacterium]|nr:N-acetylglucosamine-6-phosphate deacetylase [Planctomycetota bacterium]
MTQHHGYVDLQINGIGGIDFNESNLLPSSWESALERLAQDGTTDFLPTLITDSVDSLCLKIANISKFCEASAKEPSIPSKAVGIHLEGPFLSDQAGYIGAHPKEHAMAMDLDALKRLVDAANGSIRLVTLAPECDPKGIGIEYLAQQNILVAAGHCNPSIDQLRCAIDSGLSLFTHLGNACPGSIPRHDNIIHRVLALRDTLRVTLIADGFHLPLWLLDSWVDWFGEQRVAIVSDAISAAGLAPGIYQLGQQKVAVGADGVPRSHDQTHFVGSGATLGRMRNLCESQLSWSSERIEKLFKTNAAQWLGLPSD